MRLSRFPQRVHFSPTFHPPLSRHRGFRYFSISCVTPHPMSKQKLIPSLQMNRKFAHKNDGVCDEPTSVWPPIGQSWPEFFSLFSVARCFYLPYSQSFQCGLLRIISSSLVFWRHVHRRNGHPCLYKVQAVDNFLFLQRPAQLLVCQPPAI